MSHESVERRIVFDSLVTEVYFVTNATTPNSSSKQNILCFVKIAHMFCPTKTTMIYVE